MSRMKRSIGVKTAVREEREGREKMKRSGCAHRVPWDRSTPVDHPGVVGSAAIFCGSEDLTIDTTEQRAQGRSVGQSIAQGGERPRHELTFPRNKFHLVRGQITDVMRMVGAVGNYVFAVIGSPGSRRARKATARIGTSANERDGEEEVARGGREREREKKMARRKKVEEELPARSTPFFHGGPQFRVALLVFISRKGPSRERAREKEREGGRGPRG